MGIFSTIKNAIFGKDDDEKEKKVDAPDGPIVAPAGNRGEAVREVDVEKQLAQQPGSKNLNWRTSIVDLMKLLDIDSSYENRKQLAQELGRTDYSGSAEDNIWLHKATMRELAKNGGRVPADMMD